MLQQAVAEQGVGGIVTTEVHKRLINNQTYLSFLTPLGESQHVSLGDEVTRGVVGVNQHELANVLITKERHQVIGSIAKIIILWNEGRLLTFVIAIGIFLEGRTHKAYLTL